MGPLFPHTVLASHQQADIPAMIYLIILKSFLSFLNGEVKNKAIEYLIVLMLCKPGLDVKKRRRKLIKLLSILLVQTIEGELHGQPGSISLTGPYRFLVSLLLSP